MTSTEDTTSDEFSVAGVFDEARYASTAPRLRRGRVIAWFGAAVVDLRQATLDPAGAMIDARAAWGGTSIVVPRTWRVRMATRALFGGGGSDVPDDGLPADAPTLEVRAFALFGGVSVTGRPLVEGGAAAAAIDVRAAESGAAPAHADLPPAEADPWPAYDVPPAEVDMPAADDLLPAEADTAPADPDTQP